MTACYHAGLTYRSIDNKGHIAESHFDLLGRISTLSSYNAASDESVVNQIKYTFDGWGNVIKSEQAHDGAATAGTPAVVYNYADGATGDDARYVRLASVEYPEKTNDPTNGRVVYYNYPNSGGNRPAEYTSANLPARASGRKRGEGGSEESGG